MEQLRTLRHLPFVFIIATKWGHIGIIVQCGGLDRFQE